MPAAAPGRTFRYKGVTRGPEERGVSDVIRKLQAVALDCADPG
ncbi:VOC family protein, partial [Streptomyces sp. SID5926]|nr:VOC family protein [Streptomyces sp. SID5926]